MSPGGPDVTRFDAIEMLHAGDGLANVRRDVLDARATDTPSVCNSDIVGACMVGSERQLRAQPLH
jgi:hypothetical protein